MKNKKDAAVYLSVFEGVILLACILIPLFSGRLLSSGIFYFLFQLFLVFVPGLAIWLLVNKDEASMPSLIAACTHLRVSDT